MGRFCIGLAGNLTSGLLCRFPLLEWFNLAQELMDCALRESIISQAGWGPSHPPSPTLSVNFNYKTILSTYFNNHSNQILFYPFFFNPSSKPIIFLSILRKNCINVGQSCINNTSYNFISFMNNTSKIYLASNRGLGVCWGQGNLMPHHFLVYHLELCFSFPFVVITYYHMHLKHVHEL